MPFVIDTLKRCTQMEKRAQCLVSHARIRSARKGIAFDLDIHVDDLQRRIDAGFCELTGLPFNLSGGRTWDGPSLDRIVPADGYVIGNVRVVCYAVNSALGDWGLDVLLKIAGSLVAMQSCRKSLTTGAGHNP